MGAKPQVATNGPLTLLDYRLIEAEMNGFDFFLRVLKPWARDPETGCIDPFDRWACAMSVNGSTERGYAGIYVPE